MLPDGRHAAVALSSTDYASPAENSPTVAAEHLLDLNGLRQVIPSSFSSCNRTTAMASSKISPSRGHVVTGTAINEHEFEGRVMAAQLFQLAEDPRRTENEGEYRGDPALEAVRHLRLQVQRLFQGEKKKNVEPDRNTSLASIRGRSD